MFDRIPPAPAHLPDAQRGRGELVVRYEDISQDGRIGVRPLTHSIGVALWRDALVRHPAARSFGPGGVIPILSRIAIEAGGGPISVRGSVSCEGAFTFSRATDTRGETRYRLDCWTQISGKKGRTWGPPIEGAGERIPLGAVYAEHVLTRPFAPPGERKVDAFDAPGIDVLDSPWAEPDALLALPEGARFVDDGFVVDGAETVFGLGHTDSNQHVNSLVYPLLVEEAALRRLAAAGIGAARYTSFLELRFRKPCFAADAVRVVSRLYAHGDRQGVVAAVVDADAARPETPRGARTYARLELEP